MLLKEAVFFKVYFSRYVSSKSIQSSMSACFSPA